MARVLVTGATGFVGGALVRALVAAGHDVTCLVRPGSHRAALEALGVRFAEGDTGAPESLKHSISLANPESVFHAAAMLKAPWRPAFRSANVEGTRNVARACAQAARVPKLVVVSSLAAAGPAPAGRLRVESDPAAPISKYGRVKRASEEAAAEFASAVPVTIVRPPMVFGDADRSALPLFRMAARGLAVVPGTARHRVSLVHADDLAALLVALIDRGETLGPAPGEGVYQVDGSDAPTTGELLQRIGAACGRPRVRVVALPRALPWLAAAASEAWGRLRDRPTVLNLDKVTELHAGAWAGDATKARKQLGFQPLALDARLAQTAAGYRGRGWLP
jgi:nucleoside-diphosphate-sugar epimerase